MFFVLSLSTVFRGMDRLLLVLSRCPCVQPTKPEVFDKRTKKGNPGKGGKKAREKSLMIGGGGQLMPETKGQSGSFLKLSVIIAQSLAP